jgi:hypothetical protein
MTYTPVWECEYCGVKYKKESAFMSHQCSEMIKAKQLKSPDGILAYQYYVQWMKEKGRKAPDPQTFSYSRFFTSFINFVAFVKKLQIPSVDRYIYLMSIRDLSPMLWCRDECYAVYLEWSDKTSTPIEQAEITVNTIFEYANKREFDYQNFFSELHPGEIFSLIQQRKLSMWVLLNSQKFRAILNALPLQERKQLSEMIGFEYWARKINDKPEAVQQMKQIVSELGI